ncbi:MAG TPA: hypothetical protein VGF67_30170 [Ktedonobacteraceae bacterium]|jgi:hypothetical protein
MQRHRSDIATLRTPPPFAGYRCTQQVWEGYLFPVRQAVWDSKALPTIADTLVLFRFVRGCLRKPASFICHALFSIVWWIRSLSLLEQNRSEEHVEKVYLSITFLLILVGE